MSITSLILLAAGAYLAIGFYRCYVANPSGQNTACPAGVACSGTTLYPCSNQNLSCVLGWPAVNFSTCGGNQNAVTFSL
jgi:hypothetical protein